MKDKIKKQIEQIEQTAKLIEETRGFLRLQKLDLARKLQYLLDRDNLDEQMSLKEVIHVLQQP